jgi:sarcosine oxidase subunit beta
MPDRDVVIVGAGALGLTCADQLTAREGFRVTVVDKAFPASGSSGLSAGVFTRSYVDPLALAIRVRAVEQLTALEASDGLELRRIGVLRLARDEAALAGYADSVALQHELGVTESRVVDIDDLARILPHLALDGILGALFCPTDGYLDGAQLCGLLADRMQARGGRLLVRTTVRDLRREGGRYAVVTDRETLPADVIVNAAGAWGAQVGAALEAPIDVVNERHEAYTFQLPEGVGYTVPMTLDYVPGRGNEGLYFRQEGERQLVVGMHSNEILGHPVDDPDDYFRGVTGELADVVVERLAAALPGLEGIGYQGGWSGLYPHAPDQRLALGPHPANPDVIVGAGLGGIGLGMSPALGEILADWVEHGEPRRLPDTVAFAPGARESLRP